MSSELLINIRPNQTRVAYVEDQTLTDFKIEKRTNPTLVGSVFKGRVLRVLPGMQAAFVDVALNRSGFLYVGDILENMQSMDFFTEAREVPVDATSGAVLETVEEVTSHQSKTPIQELVNKGQEIMVQVAKDPLGTKGARLTTHISLPGRLLVYMPNVDHIGVSRKIESEDEKTRLKETIEGLKPNGGVIVRTAGEGAKKEDLKEDLEYLYRVWEDVQKNYEKKKNVGLVFSDLDVELRALRDMLNEDVTKIYVDDKKVYKKISQFLSQFLPSFKNRIKLYTESQPLFDMYDLDLEISRSLQRKIWLKSGGYIVIDEAEALVVVDVNTGRFVGKKDLEDTILKTNLEAVKEIAHQLRIRNCGGIIILDLIDMESEVNREKVVNCLADELKKDRARTAIITLSELGLVEMTRKRTRPSLVSTLCEPCPYCDGKAYIKHKTTVSNEIFRVIEREGAKLREDKALLISCHPEVADWIYEEENETLEFVESKLGQAVIFKVELNFHLEQYEVHKVNKQASEKN